MCFFFRSNLLDGNEVPVSFVRPRLELNLSQAPELAIIQEAFQSASFLQFLPVPEQTR